MSIGASPGLIAAAPKIDRSTRQRQRTARHVASNSAVCAIVARATITREAVVFAQIAIDLRYAARIALRRKWVSVAVIASMGFGIAGTTAIVAVIDRILLRPLPVVNPKRSSRSGKELLL
jgi:hypothetical protein